MERKTIEQAAQKYVDAYCPDESPVGYALGKKVGYIRGFKNGAQWRINSVWHDANEKPNGMFVILIDFGTEISPEEFGLGLTAEDLNGARRWAYVSDLLPERKEETK